MDKNIAALLREDARTVHVAYFETSREQPQAFGVQPAVKTYTYVTHLPVEKDDIVVVQAGGQIKLAKVVRTDEEVKLDPNDPIKYAWVISKVDMAAFEANAARNREIEEAVADAYRKNMRRGFAEQVLGALPAGKRAEVRKLLK